MLSVEFKAGTAARPAEATYKSSDFALEYKQRRVSRVDGPSTLSSRIEGKLGIRGASDVLAIAGTLTLTFSASTRELFAFDAYTNHALWDRGIDLALPKLSGTGSVHLVLSVPEKRIGLSVEPMYTYCGGKSLLKIALDRESEEAGYYRVSERLIIGIQLGKLASLLVQGLEVS